MDIYMMDLLTRYMVSFPFLKDGKNTMLIYLWYWCHCWVFNGYR